MTLGIDFGTTHTVVAVADRGNYPLVTFEADGLTSETYPSLVAERDGELRFGLEAARVTNEDGWSQARSFKRLLSQPDVRRNGLVTMGSTRLPVQELLTRFLSALGEALRTNSNLPKAVRQGELEAIVASPANAFCTQRFLTLEAFRQAGIAVKAMLNEPSAAGFEYAHRHARTLTSKREHVVVYDLGGGTFDASLVTMSGTSHDVLSTAGLAELGGDDFDEVLLGLVIEELALEKLSRAQRQRLLNQCRQAKEALTPNSKRVIVDVEAALGEETPLAAASISASEYFAACEPLVNKTLEAMAPIVNRSGAEEGLSDDVAGIYVVGGASSLPVVGRSLRNRFGRRVYKSPYPHAAVAIGLAIAGDQSSPYHLSDRFSRTFGVFREAENGVKASYDPIFVRETPLPRQGEPRLTVERRYRPAHDVGHYRFFECAALDEQGNPVGDMAPLSDVRFAFEPALRGRTLEAHEVKRLDYPGPLVEERYQVDDKGLVEVTITDLTSGYTTTHRVGSAR